MADCDGQAHRHVTKPTLKERRALQTALLHLKPLPKDSCHTRSPLLMPLKVSMYDSTYLRVNEGEGGGGRQVYKSDVGAQGR
jgi:hypothetical protein